MLLFKRILPPNDYWLQLRLNRYYSNISQCSRLLLVMLFKGHIMALLRIGIDGLTLFSKPFDYTGVTDRNLDSITNLFNRIYINNVTGIIAENAAGKAMALNI